MTFLLFIGVIILYFIIGFIVSVILNLLELAPSYDGPIGMEVLVWPFIVILLIMIGIPMKIGIYAKTVASYIQGKINNYR